MVILKPAWATQQDSVKKEEKKREGRRREERKEEKGGSRQAGWGDGPPLKCLSHRPEGLSLILRNHRKKMLTGDVDLDPTLVR